MSKILVLGTGGTIASTPTENGLSATLSGEDILNYCDISEKDADITVENLFSIDSTLMQPEDWIKIAEAISERVKEYDGMIITHGTDTMAYTASMLSFMLGLVDKPVIITGSMKSVVEENTDATVNMRDSITAAGSGIQGVYGVFNRKLIKGSRISKLKSVQFDAFTSVNYPFVGEFTDKGISFSVKPEKNNSGIKLDTAFDTSIAVIKLFPGLNPELVKTLYNAGYKGIVIESYGTGGIPYRGRDLLAEITEIASEIPVLLTTQVVFDGVDLHTYEVGQRALSSGAISAYDMSKEASITKLMWVLGHTHDLDKVKEMVYTNYAGEINTDR
jgi:L-asparaginase